MFSRDWFFWLIVIALVAIPRLLGKLLSAGKRAEPPAASTPRLKRTWSSRREPVRSAKQPPQIDGERQAATDQLRRVLQQLKQAATDQIRRAQQQLEQPAPPPGPAATAAAAIREAESTPPPAPKAPSLPPPPAMLAEPRATQVWTWAEALRNKRTLRQIIISAEIIGPPKGG